VTVKHPLDQPSAGATEGAISLEVLKWIRQGRAISLKCRVSRRVKEGEIEDGSSSVLSRIVLHDAGGRELQGRESLGFIRKHEDDSGTVFRKETTMLFELPEAFEIATVDLVEPSDSAVVRIPFDVGETPLR
jgi:hypothetical protein